MMVYKEKDPRQKPSGMTERREELKGSGCTKGTTEAANLLQQH